MNHIKHYENFSLDLRLQTSGTPGGYINCSKEEVQDYIDDYEFTIKYNL